MLIKPGQGASEGQSSVQPEARADQSVERFGSFGTSDTSHLPTDLREQAVAGPDAEIVDLRTRSDEPEVAISADEQSASTLPETFTPAEDVAALPAVADQPEITPRALPPRLAARPRPSSRPELVIPPTDVVTAVQRMIDTILIETGIDPHIHEVEVLREQAELLARGRDTELTNRAPNLRERIRPTSVGQNQQRLETTQAYAVIDTLFESRDKSQLAAIDKVIQRTDLMHNSDIKMLPTVDGDGKLYLLSDEGVAKVRASRTVLRDARRLSFDGQEVQPAATSEDIETAPDSMVETIIIADPDSSGTLLQLRPSLVSVEVDQVVVGNLTRINAVALTAIGLAAVLVADAERRNELIKSFRNDNQTINVDRVAEAIASLLDQQGPDSVLQSHQRTLGVIYPDSGPIAPNALPTNAAELESGDTAPEAE